MVNTNSIKLSREIYSLDKKVSTNKVTRVTKRQVIGYAVADGMAAWSTFKGTVGFAGPGYGAAFGFLGGICGSLYYGYDKGDYGRIRNYTPPKSSLIETKDLNSPNSVGLTHNNLLAELVNNPQISYDNYTNLMSSSYNYLVQRTATKFNLDENIIRTNFTLDNYKKVGVEDKITLPLDIDLEVAKGGNINILNYVNEYLIRFENPNATFEDLILYSDYFMGNVDQNSSFTPTEIYNIKATISVFKNSLLYWQNV